LDPDEVFVLVASVIVALLKGIPWYVCLTFHASLRPKGGRVMRTLLGVLPGMLLVALAVALRAGAAREVREDQRYIVLFVALGAAWLVLTVWATARLGISLRDDALERRNLAAGVASAGALVSSMIIYTFANFGEGETIWTTIGPAFLAASACWAVWAAHQIASGAADAITIDRDTASALRFAGMAIGTSLIFGRAIAGDYESAADTLSDLGRQAWPALPVAILAVVMQLRLRPSPQRPRPDVVTRGLIPALAYVMVGVLDLAQLGYWGPAGARQ
jgi:hypothetical protein